MLQTAYITKASKFLPNHPITNNEMEEFLGQIKGLRSKAKSLVLRNNGIKTRYYVLKKNGDISHTNAELTVEAIKRLANSDFKLENIELLTCGTGSPDQNMPSHASMVHGKLGINPIDVMSASGSCNSSMWTLNYAWMSILTGKYQNAVCTGSEVQSTSMLAKNFEEESKKLESLGENPYVAFEKEFLRWMLSDGASAILIENKPSKHNLSLRIDWLDIRSYANRVETCMFSGGIKNENGDIIPWRNIEPNKWLEESVFCLQQDARLLEKHITNIGGEYLKELIVKYKLSTENITYFLPHLSSEYFRKKILESLIKYKIDIPNEKWFTNLDKVGNVATASAFLMLDELLNSNKLKEGDTLLIMVPESARFSYTYVHLTVV